MKNFLKNTAKHTLVYGLGGILQRSIGFLLLPIYLRYLTPYDYGILALLDVISLLFGSLILQGLPTALFRSFSYDYLGISSEQKEAVGTAYLYLLISPLIFYGLLFFTAPHISSVVFKESDHVLLVRLIFLTGFFGASSNIPFVVMRAKLQSKLLVTISVVRCLINISFNIYFVVFMQMRVEGIVWGNLLTAVFMFLLSPALLHGNILWKIAFNKLKNMLLFGWPLMPGAIAMWILASTDRYFLEHFSTTSELGLYSLGSKIALILTTILLHPFQVAWPAIFYPKAKEGNASVTFSRFSTYFLLIAGGAGICLILAAEPLIKLIGPEEYWQAHTVVPILVFSVILGNQGLQSIIGTGLFLKKKTQYAPLIVSIGAIVNIVLNWLLVPSYGMMGAAIATLLCTIVMLISAYKISSHFYPITLEVKRISQLTSILILITVANYFIMVDSLFMMLIAKFLLIISYPVSLYLTGFFNGEEKDAIKTLKKRGLDFVFG